jgi:hypothetical protein
MRGGAPFTLSLAEKVGMVDPRQKCAVGPLSHAKRRLLERGLSQPDLERMIHWGTWIAEGGPHHDVVYRGWHIKVKLLHCLIRVKTAFEESTTTD